MSDLIPHDIALSPEIIGVIVFAIFGIALAYFVMPSTLAISLRRFRMPVDAGTGYHCPFRCVDRGMRGNARHGNRDHVPGGVVAGIGGRLRLQSWSSR